MEIQTPIKTPDRDELEIIDVIAPPVQFRSAQGLFIEHTHQGFMDYIGKKLYPYNIDI